VGQYGGKRGPMRREQDGWKEMRDGCGTSLRTGWRGWGGECGHERERGVCMGNDETDARDRREDGWMETRRTHGAGTVDARWDGAGRMDLD